MGPTYEEIVAKMRTDPFYTFSFPDRDDVPTALRDLILTVAKGSYREFNPKGTSRLEDALNLILEAAGPPESPVGQRRCVYIAWALALAVRPMIARNSPDDHRPDLVLSQVKAFLEGGGEGPGDRLNLFPELETAPFTLTQEVCDALIMFSELPMALDREKTRRVLLDVLDLVFTGGAIYPCREGWQMGSFNWFLSEVVPAAYNLRLPAVIYRNPLAEGR
jgi:hypothetical protein